MSRVVARHPRIEHNAHRAGAQLNKHAVDRFGRRNQCDNIGGRNNGPFVMVGRNTNDAARFVPR